MLSEKPRVFTAAGEIPESVWEFVEDRPGGMRIFRYVGAEPIRPTAIHSLAGQDVTVLPGVVYTNGMLLSVRKGVAHPRLTGVVSARSEATGEVIREGKTVRD